MDKYRITLTVEERFRLEQLVSSGKSAARRLTHARVLLLADELHGEPCLDAKIVSSLGTSVRTIERLRNRFVTEGLEAALDHRPQPPRPDKVKIKGSVEQKLVELETEVQAQIEKIHDQCDTDQLQLDKLDIPPRKSDITVNKVALVWVPWKMDASGNLQPAS